ncbi:MAG: 30S ribosomal protein S9 [Chloroflexi bacterium]|nr:30S ribosomal protein S9 [Chloroflexota bacterium]MCH2523937.1 30S ribosomal protein S9 [Dehalococcoidia bacterium]|tara:strand:- start:563 stop:961 length:399 start_codon:yes stop_codon:yes gene_type:complete
MTTEQRYFYGLGRRKSAIARVRLYPGEGTVVVNGKPMEEVIPRESLRNEILRPLVATDNVNNFNIQVRVEGGGVSGWAGAISHGVSRALVVYNDTNKALLRAEGLLTRDARVKERKKPGLKRARKAPQFTKR